MTKLFLSKRALASDYFGLTADGIASSQRRDGAIPWFEGGPVDPWDHVEAAMGLSIAGHRRAAERAYLWLRETQLSDGSWWTSYRVGSSTAPDPRRRESNSVAYVATGVWHHYLITRDRAFLLRMWPAVEAAIEFVLELQMPRGVIQWGRDSGGQVLPGALLAGCSSILKSLECALWIASALDERRSHWQRARLRLAQALRRWPGSSRADPQDERQFSMDWFYPVLCGAMAGPEARTRLRARWGAFVEDGRGCRCVAERAWVSVAESCELCLAMLAAGESHRAASLFSWVHQYRDADGGYWTGYICDDRRIWPEEKTTWTAGVVLMAADALTGYTPGARLFACSPPSPALVSQRARSGALLSPLPCHGGSPRRAIAALQRLSIQ